jgi:hypothetical protein
MNCCPSADFKILANGIEAKEYNIQADAHTLQFFPFSNIISITYNHSRDEGGLLSITTKKTAYYYHFPCSTGGRQVYDQLIAALP